LKEKKKRTKRQNKKPKKKVIKRVKAPVVMDKSVITNYCISANGFPADITISKHENDFVPSYSIKKKSIEKATMAVLDRIREKLIKDAPVEEREVFDLKQVEQIKLDFVEKIKQELKNQIPDLPADKLRFLSGYIVNTTIGLGDLEIPLSDENLEEVTVNNSDDPAWVYHREYGWLKSNIKLASEEQIENYASLIGRKVGKRITVLTPLMDAHLLSGDRVNATLFPISSQGNTLTIRKFRKKPMTITELFTSKTVSLDVLALLWQAIQYEISIIVSGGTASGKTTFLSALMCFTPPNQRVLSIEDTREIQMPKFLHWVPLTTRTPSSEGTGEVSMLDLLVNSLRMRPDRIIVGEIRRQREAEVLFESLHTGHSVYSTLHADTASQTIDRMTTPPINLPPSVITALPLIVVMYRQRRKNFRRVFEIGEIVTERAEPTLNVVYRWSPREDEISQINESIRFAEELQLHTGMTKEEMRKDMAEKKKVLSWIFDYKIDDLDAIGQIISSYYTNPSFVLKNAKEDTNPRDIIKWG
jgi:flagellar protein FlaI